MTQTISDTALATPMEVMHRISEIASSVKADSLQEYTSVSRLSPVVVIDSSLMDINPLFIKALLQTKLSIFSMMYLSAIQLDLSIGNCTVMKLLDKFATDRDLLRAAGTSNYLTTLQNLQLPWENYVSMQSLALQPDQLPTDWTARKNHTVGELALAEHKAFSMQDDGDEVGDSTVFGSTKTAWNKDFVADSNLAVGKIIEVPLSFGDKSMTMLVTAQLAPVIQSPEALVDIAKATGSDTSYMGRFHQMRSGQIRAIRDWCLNLDLIEADKKAIRADKSGTLFNARTRRTKNMFAALVSGRASVNSVSAMLVISKTTASRIEQEIGGKFENYAVRQKWFAGNIQAMLSIVDPVLERFTLYQRGIAEPASYTLEDIKAAATKTNASDMEAILKAYKLGDAAPL